jgi:HAE1 family hydrophobic/amphiphilic exporter-1
MVTLASYAAAIGAGVYLFLHVPSGFLPEEDQGYFIVMAQGPSGTSLGHTERIMEAAEKTLHAAPEVRSTFQVDGFSFSGNGPNRGIIFVDMKPWDQRPGPGHKTADVIERIRMSLLSNEDGLVFAFAPPAINGVGSVGGFQFEVEDQSGGTVAELAAATSATMAAASQSRDLVGMYSSFTADDPQLFLRVNRERAKQLNVPLSDVFQTLQVYAGSEYVNDFTFSNRSYRVYVQADQDFRGNPKDLTSFYTRSRGGAGNGLSATGLPLPGGVIPSSGSMVSLDNLVDVTARTSAAEIAHYNLFRSTEINGAAAPGKSSGQAVAAMEEIAKKSLPQGFGYEWTGIADEQIASGNATILIFSLAIILVFLVLAAQYESFSLPFIVLLSVPLGLLGALGGQMIRGQANDVFCQVGLVMLIGLSAKNAILIVEFANQLRERGHSIADAALEAARERLRPILMTSFSFILGVFPLVIAEGSGAESRHSLGTTVFGGMLVSTVMNLFFVPTLYAMVEGLRERVTHRAPIHAESAGNG